MEIFKGLGQVGLKLPAVHLEGKDSWGLSIIHRAFEHEQKHDKSRDLIV